MSAGVYKFWNCILSLSLICLTQIIPTSTATVQGNETDQLALLAFKEKIIHDPQGAFSSWNMTLNFCSWAGITCSEQHKRVTSINLASKGFVGSLPRDIGNMSFLTEIVLTNNSLQGTIPQEVDRLFRLQVLSLGQNALEGKIPDTLGRVDRLVILELFSNNLSGMIPNSVFNLSSLNVFNLANNELQGSIPTDFGLTHHNLEKIQLSDNRLSGTIPISLSNASKLQVIDLQFNSFIGPIPADFGWLLFLQKLVLTNNNLGFGGKGDLSFLESLINCSSLEILNVGANNLHGSLPPRTANLSTELTMISLADNWISGSIPPGISKFINLIFISLQGNNFTGIIPPEITKLGKLQRVILSNNRFSGNIPTSIGNLSMLDEIRLENNDLNGTIPPSFGNCPMLVLLDLSQNNLSGTIPNEFFHVSPFSVKLNLSRNHLVGSLSPGIGTLKTLIELDISENEFSGLISAQLGACIALNSLYIQGNFFQGYIPQSMRNLRSLQNIDLSRNNLSGKIPDFFATLSLIYLNLSWNNLEGEVPTKGVFANAIEFSIAGNTGLCGGIPGLQLPRCSSDRSNKHKVSSDQLFFLIGYILGLLTFCWIIKSSDQFLFSRVHIWRLLAFSWIKRKIKMSRPTRQVLSPFIRVPYQQLHQATNGFSPTNLVSKDCFGSVYKGEIGSEYQEKSLAIKVFNEESSKAFNTECKVLLYMIQRNIVTIRSTCLSTVKNREFRAIVYNLKEHGRLESWLHPTNMTFSDAHNVPRTLNLGTKINIAIDVATALDYLHYQHYHPMVHCNLKPSNIWLDTNMSAHLSNFGLAKLITEIDSTTHSSLVAVAGTCGYMPPEYYRGSRVSTKGDVYSYGIILLEMLTGKKATDLMFDEGFKLQNFVSNALPYSVRNIIDPVNLHELDTGNAAETEICLSMLFDIGVKCAMEVPQFRPCIDDTLSMLEKVRSKYMDPKLVTLSYMDLRQATNGFSSTNLVGAGAFGSVYKGRFISGKSGIENGTETAVAIKVFNLERRGAVRSFNTEYRILRDIQHPNLVKMITACTSVDQEGHDFRAILYEFMDCGSLDMSLCPTNKKFCDGPIKPHILSLQTRINIATDVASALNYLHQQICCIVHCDLKPGNILLDKNRVACIADFGLATSLPESPNFNQGSSSTGIRGTPGYIAPEYGIGCQMTTKGDTYSFGILLLEMLTGKKPTHHMFRDGLNLHSFVSLALPNDVINISDPLMKLTTSASIGDDKRVEYCLTKLYIIGLACSKTSPKDRPDMRKLLRELESIKNSFGILLRRYEL
ncbi:putative receptor-like protein kinase At3g47110 [Daucus carota subsp. sativus]|uniref:putative receptor-like protein kinase At3g47110 n=1 Tax=Daucus carota subsp. sativus TaxID=79200 RepID=UPI0007EF2946|nr:PREDICTED: putative receptor-like protein kinase At3g47110 [Daucus carota subsp. sativus]